MKKFIVVTGVFLILCFTSVCFPQWTQIGPNSGTNFVDPKINTFFVSGDTLFAGNNLFGLHYSTDFGVTWCETGMLSGNITSIAKSGTVILTGSNKIMRSVNSGNNFTGTNILSGGIQCLAIYGNNAVSGIGSDGIYVSTNAGSNWTNSIPTGTYYAAGADAQYLYIGLNGGGVKRSSNNGISWEQTPLFFADIRAMYIDGSKIYAGTTNEIYLSTNQGSNWQPLGLPQSIRTIYATGSKIIAGTLSNGVFISTNGGANWTQTALNSQTINSVALIGNTIMAVDNSIFYKSTNNGTTWQQQAYHFMQGNTIFRNSGVLYTGTNNRGVFRSDNEGVSWENIPGPNELTGVRSFGATTNKIFAGTNERGILTSPPGGYSWDYTSVTLNNIYAIYTAGNTVIAATERNAVMYSSDNGVNWSTANLTGVIYSVDGISSYMYAAGPSGVYISTNGGSLWTQTSLTDPSVNCFTFIGTNVYAGANAKVYLSTDNGINWTDFPILGRVNSLSNYNGVLYAGTEKYGVYVSTNNGQSWFNVNKNLGINLSVYKTFVANNHLFISTYTTSIISAPLSSLVGIGNGINEVSYGYTLNQNYPNPFNPVTVISFSLPKRSNVVLRIYDIEGKEISTLINDVRNSGNHEVKFDGTGLTSGVYFYKIESDNYSETKRMVLIK